MMPISVVCRCGARFKATDESAGREGRCRKCGALFVVPDHELTSSLRIQVPKPAEPESPPIEASPRPTLAVVQGACVGGGMALLLALDLRIAAGDAHFSMMEMRYAFLPDLGHIPRLQREVGMARAKEMLFFADRVPAATMERWGVVNEVVPRAGLDEAAARWTARCAATPPLAIAHLKPLMLADPAGADVTEGQRSALEANLRLLLHTRDFREGLAAQAERRAPNFAGE